VLTAKNGHEALRTFSANPVRAAVLDYTMPGINGGELAAKLKRLQPEIKVMMLSAELNLPSEVTRLVDVSVVKGTSRMAFLAGVKQLLP
jgi:CheY-like chemotaxis protein